MFAFVLVLLGCSLACALSPFEPDEVIMKDGKKYQGLIVKNSSKQIILEQQDGEITLLKSDVARIDDIKDDMIAFTGLVPPGQLPPWRMMLQDFKNNDGVTSFYQIPATRINHGYLKNIPYLSYAVNRFSEFDVFGNPDRPVCIAFGAYSPVLSKKKFQRIAREFIAGFLASRADIHTLYHLNLNGDEQRSGKFIFKVTPPLASGSHGAWWLSIYDPARLEKARVSDAKYKKITLPYIQVRNVIGALRTNFRDRNSKFLSETVIHWVGKMPDLQGFYRTSKNQLRLIFEPHAKSGDR